MSLILQHRDGQQRIIISWPENRVLRLEIVKQNILWTWGFSIKDVHFENAIGENVNLQQLLRQKPREDVVLMVIDDGLLIEGDAIDIGLFGLFLQSQFPNVCVPYFEQNTHWTEIAKSIDVIVDASDEKKIKPTHAKSEAAFYPFYVVWANNVNIAFRTSSVIAKQVTRCITENKPVALTFILPPPAGDYGNDHANALYIYRDSKTGILTAEHFEPHGPFFSGQDDEINALYEALYRKLPIALREMFGVEKYIAPSLFCPTGLQDRQENFSDFAFWGTCVMWSFWYLSLRMRNPQWTPEETKLKIERLLETDPSRLNEVVGRFKQFTEQFKYAADDQEKLTLLHERFENARRELLQCQFCGGKARFKNSRNGNLFCGKECNEIFL